ncbi:MAG: endolytic transglycosylase MltG [Lachnospiraceae bacterium]|nr:endolytic transglycosylase MltG [Lachnospiraceae bacterium]
MDSSKIVIKVLGICSKVLVYVLVLAVVVIIGRMTFRFGYRVFAEPAMTSEKNAKTVSLEIKKGMNKHEIADMVKEKGLCRSASLFYVQIMISDYEDDLKPGTYEVNTGMKPDEIIAVLGGYTEEEEE